MPLDMAIGWFRLCDYACMSDASAVLGIKTTTMDFLSSKDRHTHNTNSKSQKLKQPLTFSTPLHNLSRFLHLRRSADGLGDDFQVDRQRGSATQALADSMS